uniref:BHLH domain-containing protein n=1 Tax=Magallana gigas TaxID=29159 RepID=A0A8W8LKD9_MAGGI|nr:uncharacterized protein LOC105326867 [Crassostrea gigas]
MYSASKRLQAVRRQLLHMDEQYRNGLDIDEDNSMVETENCQDEPKDLVEKNLSKGFINSSASTTAHDQQNCGSVDIENVLGSIVDCGSSEDIDNIPLSEELRSAISNMEDLDDVDCLIGNVINAVQVDASFDQDLETLEQSVSSPDSPLGRLANYRQTSSIASGSGQSSLKGSAQQSMTWDQEESWRKDRRKKDNHNIIERRRRYNINDRIKEIGTLLPSSIPPDLKKNKGSILKAAVEFIKELKRENFKVHKQEENLRVMNSKHQKQLFRIFQLELKIKLYGLTEDMDDVKTRKKKPKRRLSEINAMVEGFCKQSTMSLLQQTEEKELPSCKKNKLSKFREQKCNQNLKQGLRQYLSKKMAAGMQADDKQFEKLDFFHAKNQFEVQEKTSHMMINKKNEQATKDIPKSHRKENISLGTDKNSSVVAQNMEEVIELTTEQCNILLDLFENQGSVNEILINSEDMIQQGSSALVRECSAEQDCLSPVTSTSNMLEKLLRRSGSSSDSSGLEDSTESTTGLQ